MFQNRNGGHKVYEQNQNVYNYYRDIYQQKARKDKELERKLVDNVQQRNNEEAEKKRLREMSDKEKKNVEMKDTLEKQLELLNRRKE